MEDSDDEDETPLSRRNNANMTQKSVATESSGDEDDKPLSQRKYAKKKESSDDEEDKPLSHRKCAKRKVESSDDEEAKPLSQRTPKTFDPEARGMWQGPTYTAVDVMVHGTPASAGQVDRTEFCNVLNAAMKQGDSRILLAARATDVQDRVRIVMDGLEELRRQAHPFDPPIRLRMVNSKDRQKCRVTLKDVSLFYEPYMVAFSPIVPYQIPRGMSRFSHDATERLFDLPRDATLLARFVRGAEAVYTAFRGRSLVTGRPTLDRSAGILGFHVPWRPPRWLVEMQPPDAIPGFTSNRWFNPVVKNGAMVYGVPSVDPTILLRLATDPTAGALFKTAKLQFGNRFHGLFPHWIQIIAGKPDWLFDFLSNPRYTVAVASWGEKSKGCATTRASHGRALFKTFPSVGRVRLHAVDSWMQGIHGSDHFRKTMRGIAARLKSSGLQLDPEIAFEDRAKEQTNEGTCMLHAVVRALAIADLGRRSNTRLEVAAMGMDNSQMWAYAVLARRLAEMGGIGKPGESCATSKYAAGNPLRVTSDERFKATAQTF